MTLSRYIAELLKTTAKKEDRFIDNYIAMFMKLGSVCQKILIFGKIAACWRT